MKFFWNYGCPSPVGKRFPCFLRGFYDIFITWTCLHIYACFKLLFHVENYTIRRFDECQSYCLSVKMSISRTVCQSYCLYCVSVLLCVSIIVCQYYCMSVLLSVSIIVCQYYSMSVLLSVSLIVCQSNFLSVLLSVSLSFYVFLSVKIMMNFITLQGCTVFFLNHYEQKLVWCTFLRFQFQNNIFLTNCQLKLKTWYRD